jgi:hypothetical protein
LGRRKTIVVVLGAMFSSMSLYDAPLCGVTFLDHRRAGIALAPWPSGVAEG